MTIDEERKILVKEAMEWIGTPYVPAGRVKGKNGGVDCLTVVMDIFHAAGFAPLLPIPGYRADWFMHDDTEFYLDGKDGTPGILTFCDEVSGPPERIPLPGDIVLWKFGRVYSHATIVLDWPVIIHAWFRKPVGRDNAEQRTVLQRIHEIPTQRNQLRPRKYLRLKRWAE